MPHERERQRKIAAIKAELARQIKRNAVVLAAVTVVSVLALALLLAFLSGALETISVVEDSFE